MIYTGICLNRNTSLIKDHGFMRHPHQKLHKKYVLLHINKHLKQKLKQRDYIIITFAMYK